MKGPPNRAAGALALASATVAASQEPVTAFVNVAVLPLDSERVLEGQTVGVRAERIVARAGAPGRTRSRTGRCFEAAA